LELVFFQHVGNFFFGLFAALGEDFFDAVHVKFPFPVVGVDTAFSKIKLIGPCVTIEVDSFRPLKLRAWVFRSWQYCGTKI